MFNRVLIKKMKNGSAGCAAMILMLIFSSNLAWAEQIILDQKARLDFTPQNVFFIVDHGQQIRKKYQGVLVPPLKEDTSLNERSKWHFCTAVQVAPGAESISFSVFLIGKNNRYQYISQVTWNVKEIEAYSGSVDQLRDYLLQQKKVLRSWNVELKAQQKSLGRLRADAEIIGNTRKLNELQEYLEQEKYSLANIETDITSLKEFLRRASGGKEPKGFYKRQRELTVQLAELATAAREAESGETKRRAVSEMDLQRQLLIVQMTRMDDYDSLQTELLRIRRKRLWLEKEHGLKQDTNFDDYALPDQG